MREAIDLVEEILGGRSFEEGQEPHVSFDGYGPHSLRIALWYTSPTGDYFEAMQERTEVNLEILERFGEAGLEFAFPTRTVHLEAEDASEAEAEEREG
jgi:MscS family membrane protein